MIHRHTFHTQMNKDSKQLGSTLPKIEVVQKLPQISRLRLAHLRTEYCPLLISYLSTTCSNLDDRCLKGDVAPHLENHNFNRIKKATKLIRFTCGRDQ